MSRISLLLVVMVSGCAAPPRESLRPTAASSTAAAVVRDGISREAAVDAARDALQQLGEDWTMTQAEVGAIGRIRPGWQEEAWGKELPGDRPVWRVVLVAGELSAEVIINFTDGSVYSSTVGIAN